MNRYFIIEGWPAWSNKKKIIEGWRVLGGLSGTFGSWTNQEHCQYKNGMHTVLVRNRYQCAVQWSAAGLESLP